MNSLIYAPYSMLNGEDAEYGMEGLLEQDKIEVFDLQIMITISPALVI